MESATASPPGSHSAATSPAIRTAPPDRRWRASGGQGEAHAGGRAFERDVAPGDPNYSARGQCQGAPSRAAEAGTGGRREGTLEAQGALGGVEPSRSFPHLEPTPQDKLAALPGAGHTRCAGVCVPPSGGGQSDRERLGSAHRKSHDAMGGDLHSGAPWGKVETMAPSAPGEGQAPLSVGGDEAQRALVLGPLRYREHRPPCPHP
jgi:hypothetical protein